MIRTAWHPLARRELQDASATYDEATSGLGRVFIDAVEQTVRQLVKLPRSGRPVRGQTRRLLIERFPYSLIYRYEPAGGGQPENLFILGHRSP